MGLCLSNLNDDVIDPQVDDSLHVMRRAALRKSQIVKTQAMVYLPREKHCYNPSMLFISVNSVCTECSDIGSGDESSV